jgi:hypothetical protein
LLCRVEEGDVPTTYINQQRLRDFLNSTKTMSTLNTTNNVEISPLQKLPIVQKFTNPDDMWENVNTLMAFGYMNLMVAKYHNEEIPVKLGEPFIVMAIGDSDDCITLPYTEDTLSDSNQIDNILNGLVEEENYELCDLLVKWKKAYDSKFNK